jgi:hypothetical protein
MIFDVHNLWGIVLFSGAVVGMVSTLNPAFQTRLSAFYHQIWQRTSLLQVEDHDYVCVVFFFFLSFLCVSFFFWWTS